MKLRNNSYIMPMHQRLHDNYVMPVSINGVSKVFQMKIKPSKLLSIVGYGNHQGLVVSSFLFRIHFDKTFGGLPRMPL